MTLDEILERLGPSLALLQRFHGATNLVGDAGPAALRAHVTEAWTAAQVAEQALEDRPSRIADVGSGAGLEALVLALHFPQAAVIALEPRRKRATFIELAADAARVRNVKVLALRLEEARLAAEFQIADARAVWAPDAWLARAAGLMAPDGVALVHTRGQDLATHRGWRQVAAASVPGGDHTVAAFVRVV